MDFFSYEHFYVIYCKFWELDKDHDLLIDKHDLARHNDHGEYMLNKHGSYLKQVRKLDKYRFYYCIMADKIFLYFKKFFFKLKCKA